MRRNSYRGFRKNKYSIKRSSSRISTESTTGLRVARALIGILIIAVISGAVWYGMSNFNSSGSAVKSTVFNNRSDSDNPNLLRVVNKTNPLDKDFVPELVEVDGVAVSKDIADPLRAMLKASEDDGISLKIESGYISYDEQGKLFKAKLKSLKGKNLSEVKAQALAERIVPRAGKSEAQTGLLVTFKTNQKGKFRSSKAYAWLQNHCIEYGFVLRYPSDKISQTSMNANFKAFRYVGYEHASVMRSLNKCFNEYVVYINSR